MKLRVTLGALVALLPRRLKLLVLRALFRFDIDDSARIGLSIVVPGRLTMGPGSSIGHLTVIRGVAKVELGEQARIGNLDWIMGFPSQTRAAAFADQPDRNPSLVVGDHAAITNRHLIDCTDAVVIGRFATFAGFRSQILTHSVSIDEARQRARPVAIGDYAFVGTGCVLLPGSSLPPYSALGAGSVLTRGFEEDHWVYAGNPAVPVKPLSGDSEYFRRTTGFVV